MNHPLLNAVTYDRNANTFEFLSTGKVTGLAPEQ